MKTMCAVPVALTNYEVTVRSFHPEKDFGWSGLCFAGDNRGFSTEQSKQRGPTTSRIWQKFSVDLSKGTVGGGQPYSDDSQARWDPTPHHYKSNSNPRGLVRVMKKHHSDDVVAVNVTGNYAGENDAMPGSQGMRNLTGFSYVPTLHVYH
jgi:hypothetical protein